MKVNGVKIRENGLKEFYNINRFKKVKVIDFHRLRMGCGCGFVGDENCSSHDKTHRWKYEDIEKLLKEIPGSPLENANLSLNDLSGVSGELLASAVSHLHIVNLFNTKITNDQCVALLKASLCSTTLQNINMAAVNLSKVPAELLANLISRLQKVNMGKTDLTTDQCVAILKASLYSKTLRNIDLRFVNLSEVPVDLLANSMSRLQDVGLYRTDLTTDQSVALLRASLSTRTLTNLSLMNIDLSEVPAELLANSISRLRDFKLYRTGLTTDQCAVLKSRLSTRTIIKLNLFESKKTSIKQYWRDRKERKQQTV